MTHQKCIHDPAQDLGGNQRVRLAVRMVVQLGHPQRALGAMAPETVDQVENGHMVRRERILDLLVRCREGILPVDFAELGQDGDEKFRAVFVRSRRQFRQRLLGRFKPRPPVLVQRGVVLLPVRTSAGQAQHRVEPRNRVGHQVGAVHQEELPLGRHRLRIINRIH